MATALSAETPASVAHMIAGGSFVVHAAEAKEKPTPNGARADYVDQATPTLARFEVHRTTLLPGRMPHAAHRHEREEMMIVLHGRFEALLEEKKTPSSEGSVFFMASNDLHGVTNIGETPATYLVLSFYVPPAKRDEPAADATSKTPLPSTVWDWDKLPVKASPDTDRRNLVDGPTRTMRRFEMHVTTLRPGAKTHGGKHPEEQFFVMKDGEMEAVVGGEAHRVSPGDLFFVASNQEFVWRLAGDKPATYYVVRFFTSATPEAPATH
ncbi:MAG: cupin domain-containing protein [Opitutae bacterium]|nr:cupin domain-containing protein [Opitutae bacterium]